MSGDANLDRLRQVVGRLLAIGVETSAGVIACGLVYYLLAHASGYPHGGYPRSLGLELRGLVALRPYAVISAGLLLLILTPIARVAISCAAFLRRRDTTYSILTAVVLSILVVSFVLGARLP